MIYSILLKPVVEQIMLTTKYDFIHYWNSSKCLRTDIEHAIKAFWLMVAWPHSGPATVVISVVDYVTELTIHLLYVHPFCVKEMYKTSFRELDAADCAQLVYKDLEIL